jgi:formylglycine-generating enzyme required for sulfatase activity
VVDGGTFDRTYDRTFSDAGFPVLSPDAGQADAMTDPATVHSFRLDKYLVTVGRFRQFVSAISGGGDMATGATPLWLPSTGSGKHAHLNGGKGLADSASPGSFEPGWQAVDDGNVEPTNEDLWNCTVEQVWTASPEDLEDMPVTCVNWYEAYAFCIWDGGFLPSEAEWEYAAAGGGEQRVYPWGATDPGTSNQYAIFDCNYPGNNDDAGCAKSGNIAPVGSAALGRGRWSQLDLAGDVWEWTLDHYDPYTDCTDCANLSPGGMRVFRGGGFNSGPKALVPSTRDFIEPTNREFYVGFRCARSP